jgi:hypothetical protein
MKEPRSILSDRDSATRELPDELEAPFEMANLRPKSTGLPMVIWVSECGRAKHGPRIKVSLNPGEKSNMDDTVSVTIADSPQVIGGSLASSDLKSVTRYIEVNREVLLEFWNGEIDTIELAQRLQSIG